MLGTLTYLAIPRVKEVNITHLALDDYLDLLEGSPRGKKGQIVFIWRGQERIGKFSISAHV